MAIEGAAITIGRTARRRRRWHQRSTWVREILSPTEAEATFPRLWEAADAAVPGLTDQQLARVVSLVVDTCPSCYRDDASCGCRGGSGWAGRPAR